MVLGKQKNSGKDLEQVGTFDVLIGQSRPFYAFVKFKKSGIFCISGRIWAKLVLEPLKKGNFTKINMNIKMMKFFIIPIRIHFLAHIKTLVDNALC